MIFRLGCERDITRRVDLGRQKSNLCFRREKQEVKCLLVNYVVESSKSGAEMVRGGSRRQRWAYWCVSTFWETCWKSGWKWTIIFLTLLFRFWVKLVWCQVMIVWVENFGVLRCWKIIGGFLKIVTLPWRECVRDAKKHVWKWIKNSRWSFSTLERHQTLSGNDWSWV